MLKKPKTEAHRHRQKPPADLTIIRGKFISDLQARGYSEARIRLWLKSVDDCMAWWKARRMELSDLGESALASFMKVYAGRSRQGHWPAYRLKISRVALQAWWAFLREQDWILPAAASRSTAPERLLGRYDRYLLEVKGLSIGTRLNQQREACRFLRWLERRRGLSLRQLAAPEITSYVSQCARSFAPGSARNVAGGLRSFLRFLAWSKQVRPYLDQAVPALAPWPREDLPPGLRLVEYQQLLAVFDRATALGRRNYALALCLGELGLRAGEAAALKLEDINWMGEVLCLPQTKQRRERQLPLPPQVARAIARYLQNGRPRCNCRAVFVRHRAPLDRGLSRSYVGIAMSRAFKLAGLSARGAHVLRYRLATELQRHGVGLKSIADLLGHQSLESTARYARVDFQALRRAAVPWPEPGR